MSTKPQDDHFLELAFRSFLQVSPDLIFLKDTHLRYMGASETFARVAGLKNAQEIIGKSDYDIFDSELARHYTEDDRKVLESGIPIVDLVEPLPDQDGRKSYSSTSKYLIRDENATVIGLYGVGRDVTAQVELQEERERREQGRQMFEDVFEADITENRMLRVEGSRWEKALGLGRKSSFTEALSAFSSRFIHPDSIEEFSHRFDVATLLEEYQNGVEEFTFIDLLGWNGKDYKWTEFSCRLYYSQISKTLRLIIFMKDFDDEIRLQERLRRKAETDALTGLFNRESTLEQITGRLAASSLEDHYALLFIDLDQFKDINDSLGHPFGDRVLKTTAKQLKKIFDNNIVGRVGGDEFLVLFNGTREEIEQEIHAFFESISSCRTECGRKIRVTSSVGISMHQREKTLSKLYQEADWAMYQAKRRGKNTMVFYECVSCDEGEESPCAPRDCLNQTNGDF